MHNIRTTKYEMSAYTIHIVKVGFLQEDCLREIFDIQTEHFKRGFHDIGLNFMVGGDGTVYEGAGYSQGIHTSGNNFDSICVSFIGDFTKYEAPHKQLLAAQNFLADGVNKRKIDAAYKMYGMRQLNGYDSPGIYLYNVIKTWNHWTDKY